MIQFDYQQPIFYKFNEDSLVLVDIALGLKLEDLSPLRFADVGAGCGVIGLEFARRSGKKGLTGFFFEKQEAFIDSLKKNLSSLDSLGSFFIQHTDVASATNLSWHSFNLVFLNPPYYLYGKGRTPHRLERQECRHTSVENLSALIKFSLRLLRADGHLLLCFPRKDSAAVRLFIKKMKMEENLFFHLASSRGAIFFLVHGLDKKQNH